MTVSRSMHQDVAARFIEPTPKDHGMSSWTGHETQDFAAHYRTVPVVMDELHLVAAATPLVFEMDDDGVRPVVLVDTGAGSMVLENGHWAGAYVPAMLRAFPFVATPEGAVSLDPDSAHFHLGPKGQRLFDSIGHPTEAFKQVQSFCAQLGPALVRAKQLGTLLWQAGVLDPVSGRADLQEADTQNLFTAAPAKLRAVQGDLAMHLLQTDALALAYAQVSSLPRIAQLKLLRRVRQSPAATVDAPQAQGVDSFLAALADAQDRDQRGP